MILLRQKLTTQGVQSDEFSSKKPSIDETFRDQHNLTNHSKVRYHHGAWSEMQRVNNKQLPFANSKF